MQHTGSNVNSISVNHYTICCFLSIR